MSETYEVLFTNAGTFTRGQSVTADQVQAAGFDLDHWVKVGAVKRVGENPPTKLARSETTADRSAGSAIGQPVDRSPAKEA